MNSSNANHSSSNNVEEDKEEKSTSKTASAPARRSAGSTRKEPRSNSNNHNDSAHNDSVPKSSAEIRKERREREEMAVCEILLNEMENHEDCWPFQLPVNNKLFPTYRKIIKKPMDFVQIRNRLENSG